MIFSASAVPLWFTLFAAGTTLVCEQGTMHAFTKLLRENTNYRYTWMGQVVSEIGDHFNNIAVFSLALEVTHSGLVVSGIMLSRAVPAIMAGPLAGVLLDRMDRKRIMIASDLIRAVLAAGFIITVRHPSQWLLFLFSGLLMFASPFFTSGRASILPTIASKEELHTANSLTQTTQWTTLTVGTLLAGTSVMQFGYSWAFFLNSLSFLFSAWSIAHLRAPRGEFRAQRKALTEAEVVRPWRDYTEGLRYMKATPLILGIAVIHIGWASGGGAAQILFSLFGEIVFKRGAAGIGQVWSCAGIGLLIGGAIGHWLGRRVSFKTYKRTNVICYIVHGGAYVLFSQMRVYWLALLFIGLSRAAVAVSSVLNMTQLLRHGPDDYRGRVFSTIESITWSVMMVSMMAAGVASQYHDIRIIGTWSGVLSSTTALAWGMLDYAGRLPEPKLEGVEPEEVEVHGEPTV
jgi:MFS family permease